MKAGLFRGVVLYWHPKTILIMMICQIKHLSETFLPVWKLIFVMDKNISAAK